MDDIMAYLMKRPGLRRAAQGLMGCCIASNAVFHPAAPAPERHALANAEDFLKARGRFVRNRAGEGQKIFLRGTNAGGWLVHEEWMCPTQAPDTKTIRDTLEERFGPRKRDELMDVYRDAYWTEQDFDNCAALGMTCIRLPFIYWDIADGEGNILPDGFARLDWFVEHSARRGMYVILDLHGAYGSQNGKHHSGQINDGRRLYYDEANRARTIRLWEGVAAHYRGNPAVAGYDLLNEPENDTERTGPMQWDYYGELYQAIRAIDLDHMIFIEACWEPKDLPRPSKYGWGNVVYEYHHYSWGHQSAEGVLLHAAGNALWEHLAFRAPNLNGEFTCFGRDEAWRGSLKIYNRLNFHWTNWCYKVTGKSPNGEPHWGIYEQQDVETKLDIQNAGEEEIRAAWGRVGTEHTVKTRLGGILEEYLK
jgi:hypothetical protein